MLDIVPAHDHQPAATVDGQHVKHTETRLARPAGHRRSAKPLTAEALLQPSRKDDQRDDECEGQSNLERRRNSAEELIEHAVSPQSRKRGEGPAGLRDGAAVERVGSRDRDPLVRHSQSHVQGERKLNVLNGRLTMDAADFAGWTRIPRKSNRMAQAPHLPLSYDSSGCNGVVGAVDPPLLAPLKTKMRWHEAIADA
ncbi:hypothetical protein [Hansschlegelia plantiphila]|uniref:hypothetical protein n=1 Tax=Hansschlegelia plantiphila TaxID=374655 RepID=UPI0022F26376|nr:hypothetical protein [Hansschlegelia plantiphila]